MDSFEAATKMLTPAEPAGGFKGLRDHLAQHHGPTPQRAMLAKLAVDSIEHGVQQLMQLGHHVEVSLVEKPQHPEWPKMLYRDEGAGVESKIFAGPEDVPADGGWRETPLAAPLHEGVVLPFEGA